MREFFIMDGTFEVIRIDLRLNEPRISGFSKRQFLRVSLLGMWAVFGWYRS